MFCFRWLLVSRSASGARGFRLTALAQVLKFCRIGAYCLNQISSAAVQGGCSGLKCCLPRRAGRRVEDVRFKFLRRHCRRHFDQAMTALAEHRCPGNVRGLQNAVERAMMLCDDPKSYRLRQRRLGALFCVALAQLSQRERSTELGASSCLRRYSPPSGVMRAMELMEEIYCATGGENALIEESKT